jgi:hypothetical protein
MSEAAYYAWTECRIALVQRKLALTAMMWLVLAAVPSAALAMTKTAHSGTVTATVTYQGTYPSYRNERLTIAQAGTVFYSAPVVATLCHRSCEPSAVHVVNLEGGGPPDVVLDLFSEGAHCCSIEQVFSFDPGTMTYSRSQYDFGDPGVNLVDLGHNGRFEFLSANDAFAYTFTDFAASGLPIQIFQFSGGHFVDVTRDYPTLIAKDAGRWLKAFKSMARQHYSDSVGVIAAWAADEDLLGRSQQVASYLAQQAKAGHLNSALGPPEATGKKFVAALQRFLRRHGYLG